MFADVLERLSNQLLDAVVRSAASSSWYKNMFPLSPILDAKSLERRCPEASMMLSYLPSKVSLDDHATPLRSVLIDKVAEELGRDNWLILVLSFE